MNKLTNYFYNAGIALLIACSFSACDSQPQTDEIDANDSQFKKTAGTSRAITKADRNPEVELILDEMNYIGVGEDINVVLAGNVLFDSTKSDMLAKEHPELDKLGRLLDYYKDAHLRITGFAPEAGRSEAQSKQLAQSRANAVKQYLIDSLKIAPNRIEAVEAGTGGADNTNEKQLGQRVEVLIISSSDSLGKFLRDTVKALQPVRQQQQQNR